MCPTRRRGGINCTRCSGYESKSCVARVSTTLCYHNIAMDDITMMLSLNRYGLHEQCVMSVCGWDVLKKRLK